MNFFSLKNSNIFLTSEKDLFVLKMIRVNPFVVNGNNIRVTDYIHLVIKQLLTLLINVFI